MITVRAPQRSEPKHRPKLRPDLRVIATRDDSPEGSPAGDDVGVRRSHGGLVGTLSVVLLFVCIFGVVVFQVFLVQTQSHLDDLGTKIAHEENRTKSLRLDSTDLESPDRIVQDAKQRLGMIPPPEIAYLQPAGNDDVNAAYDPIKDPPPTTVSAVPAPVGATGSAKTAATIKAATMPPAKTTSPPTTPPTTAAPATVHPAAVKPGTPTKAKPTPAAPTTLATPTTVTKSR